MSRSGYVDDCDYDDSYSWGLWQGASAAALRGERAQMFLRAMLTSLDAMPEKRLLAEVLVSSEGCCAMGAVARHCGIAVEDLDPEEPAAVATRFGLSRTLVAEIAYENDGESGRCVNETPEQRFVRMRAWCAARIIEASPVEVDEPVGTQS